MDKYRKILATNNKLYDDLLSRVHETYSTLKRCIATGLRNSQSNTLPVGKRSLIKLNYNNIYKQAVLYTYIHITRHFKTPDCTVIFSQQLLFLRFHERFACLRTKSMEKSVMASVLVCQCLPDLFYEFY